MKIGERAILLYKQAQPLRSSYSPQLSEIELAICAAIDQRLGQMEREIERLRSRLHRHETGGDVA